MAMPTASELLASESEEEIRSMTQKLMRLTSGGRNLSGNQAAELAIYCWMTDLNPFNDEAYYMQNVGPRPGVAGVRRKAQDYLAATSSTQDDRFWVEFFEAKPGEGEFDPNKGDIAYKARLHILGVKQDWMDRRLRVYEALTEGGMDANDAWRVTVDEIGPEPVWEAVGVVDYRENFEGKPTEKRPEGTPDKWDRHERAKKRAEKWAIRKAFPAVIIPDPMFEEFQVDGEIIDVIVKDVEEDFANRVAFPEPGQVKKTAQKQAEEPEKVDKPPPAQGTVVKPENGSKSMTQDEIYQALVDDKLCKNVWHAMNLLTNHCKTGFATYELASEWVRYYNGWKDLDKTPTEAAELANEGKVPR
jgi:hypothetical protein